ncbi:iron-sulfur cluster biosynthesis family protein [Enterococcus saccharolyticus]|uniref:iron-sulfur cluster biosynthesis family protein n=1 Tax=Enterococcus saccharolyticus TaxID=41997 RepID=UPI001E3085CA|nr:iron-sulfur cluster biosynthesis family protein [Enterococcus saccharolyticus]MCD5002189.1 iron-sulfur cluster biosynthesis family protein [Enterococcus saccharolyticus]
MKLHFTEEAQARIKTFMKEDERLLLDFEDAQGPFVDSAASCQLYPNFRFLIVPEALSEELAVYDDQLATELGTVWMKKTSERYLDQSVCVRIEKAYQRLQLTSDNGILVANVPIKRIELDEMRGSYGEISSSHRPSC